jgi:hypothetical protein
VELKGRINKLTRQAEEGAVCIRLRDGTGKVFDDMTCFKEMFLTQCDLFKGRAHNSEVLDAVRNATPESLRAFEAEYGSIETEAQIIASEPDEARTRAFAAPTPASRCSRSC